VSLSTVDVSSPYFSRRLTCRRGPSSACRTLRPASDDQEGFFCLLPGQGRETLRRSRVLTAALALAIDVAVYVCPPRPLAVHPCISLRGRRPSTSGPRYSRLPAPPPYLVYPIPTFSSLVLLLASFVSSLSHRPILVFVSLFLPRLLTCFPLHL
jgi:hypothetical protein